jgi:ferritin
MGRISAVFKADGAETGQLYSISEWWLDPHTMPGIAQWFASQIEHGKITEVDAIRGHVEALGGTVDVIARVGDWTIKVA